MSRRISKIARKSVVIVADKEVGDAYCSGCVIAKGRTITVLAPFSFVEGRESLKVVFFDMKELDATLISVQGLFCALQTPFHSGCHEISLLEDEYADRPQCTFMYAPQSRRTNQKLSTFATVETLESYLTNQNILTIDSTKYFLVSCPYFGKTLSGINRLSGAPVFTMSGKTVGIVVQDCRHGVDAFGVVVSGSEMKVTLKSRHLRELMMLLDPPTPPKLKRKRDCQ